MATEVLSFWRKYQEDAWAFRKPEWIEADCESDEYLDAGIVGEIGELAEHVKKRLRGDYRAATEVNPKYFNELCIGELGDILWFMFAKISAHKISFDLLSDTVLAITQVEAHNVHSTLTKQCVALTKNAVALVDALEQPKDRGTSYKLYLVGTSFGLVMLKLNELADYFGVSLEAVAIHNIWKLATRKKLGTISGSGDFR